MKCYINIKLVGVVFFLVLMGCDALTGKEVARIQIDKTSNKELVIKETTVALKKDEDISFWAEMDLEYENELALFYTIEIWKDSKKIGGVKLDALAANPILMQVKTVIGNKTSWSFTGKMGEFEIEEDGDYTFKTVINASDNPTLVLKKADLVLKQ